MANAIVGTLVLLGLACLIGVPTGVLGDRIGPRERVALVIFMAFAVSTHSATYAVLLALSVAEGSQA